MNKTELAICTTLLAVVMEWRIFWSFTTKASWKSVS